MGFAIFLFRLPILKMLAFWAQTEAFVVEGRGGGGWLHGEQIFCFCFTKGSQVELDTSLAVRF